MGGGGAGGGEGSNWVQSLGREVGRCPDQVAEGTPAGMWACHLPVDAVDKGVIQNPPGDKATEEDRRSS